MQNDKNADTTSCIHMMIVTIMYATRSAFFHKKTLLCIDQSQFRIIMQNVYISILSILVIDFNLKLLLPALVNYFLQFCPRTVTYSQMFLQVSFTSSVKNPIYEVCSSNIFDMRMSSVMETLSYLLSYVLAFSLLSFSI